jgi:hypothetical protein
MRSEGRAVDAVTRLRWVPEGAVALTVGALASAGRSSRRSCGWVAIVLVYLALHLVEDPVLRVVWPELMGRAVRP